MFLVLLSIVFIKVLGIAQDGGVPHFNCKCSNCDKYNYLVSSIAIINDKILLIDATPDITRQVRMLDRIDGILITHLHIGHYLGLLQLGREVASTDQMPVYVTREVGQFLQQNKPFTYLISRDQIKLMTIEPGQPFKFHEVTITPFMVPHRNEDANTIGLEIVGNRKAIYVPDTDYLTDELRMRIREMDLVFLDATFYTRSELHRQENVPHPTVLDIITDFDNPEKEFYLIHLNHTNPVIDTNSEEYKHTINHGFKVAREGQVIPI